MKVADDLEHAYDPAKRREYYLKTRKLKGRTAAAIRTSKSRPTAKPKPPTKTRAQRQAERRRKLEAEVNALKARLEKLRDALAELTKQAKARSGVKPTSNAPKKTTAKKTTAKKQTSAQKAKAAKQSKEYYEKHKDEILADEVKSLKGKIKTIQERIEKMRKNGSVGARKPTAKK
jgi:chromosome segregation ATPase